MNEVGTLLQMVLVIVATVTPVVLAIQLAAGPETAWLASMLQTPGDPTPPMGVREEEPTPWRVGAAAA